MLKTKPNWKSAPIPAESGTAKWKDYCIWYISLIFSNGPKKLGSKHGGGGSFRHRLKCYGIIVNTLAPGAMFTPGCMVHDPVRTLPPEKVGRIFLADISDFPRLGHGLGQDRKPAAQNLRRCKQRIAAFSHCCQRHSASGSFCVYAKICRINM